MTAPLSSSFPNPSRFLITYPEALLSLLWISLNLGHTFVKSLFIEVSSIIPLIVPFVSCMNTEWPGQSIRILDL